MPEVVKWQRERLVNKLEEAEVQLENNRLEQELVLMAQRIDVAEELDRLEAHVKETYNILKKKEAVGRRLDFMMQEFNRESNTLASKVYQCRHHKFGYRAESLDRADARADSEHRVMPYKPAFSRLFLFTYTLKAAPP
ncbi:Domain of uncharacterised function (DUF1732) [Cedecea neteri]|uniref:Domain of uncharacterized function (DUF1732) n=1 Tax=Cedecea neteri TaxID=158822 RepID=A0A2X2T2D9_9ENTR|nr:Domain of uncharacterised function (DUF1732) [Cedecea neteri]